MVFISLFLTLVCCGQVAKAQEQGQALPPAPDSNDIVVYELKPVPPLPTSQEESPPANTGNNGAGQDQESNIEVVPVEPGRQDASPQSQAQNLEPYTYARVLFLGDIMVHGQQLRAAKREDGSYDFHPQFANIKPLLRRAMVIGNLETTLSGPESGFTGYPAFNTPDALAEALKDLGVSIVTLANNHMMDRSTEGARRTTEVLDSLGIIWTGVSNELIPPYQPLLLEYDDIKWALVNFTYGSNAAIKKDPEQPLDLNILSEETLLKGLEMARQQNPDVLVCLMHFGEEYRITPNSYQNKYVDLALENGADIVIGTHPHVLQPIKIVPSDKGYAVVAYSLGNFISNQRTRPRERSAILAVEFEKLEDGPRLKRVSVAPIYVYSSCGKGSRECRIELYYGQGEIPQGPLVSGQPVSSEPEYQSLYLYQEQDPEEPPKNEAPPLPAENPPENSQQAENSLPLRELNRIQETGQTVLDFLGATGEKDRFGFFTLWDADEPEKLPVGTRKTP